VRYDRIVLGYHGCDLDTAARLLDGESFKPSVNDYDWLGEGIYFWEYGADRAFRFAEDQQKRGKVKTPAIVGALVQLGNSFDLLDTRFTSDLATVYARWKAKMEADGLPIPTNEGKTPDKKLRHLDCAVLNWYLDQLKDAGNAFDTVRACFVEGAPVYEGSGISSEAHIQVSVRNPECILGVFRP
jgi:hypothetical protein